MEEHSLNQSACSRAGEDTNNFRSKPLWFWGVEVVGAGAIAGITAWMLGDRSNIAGWQVGFITTGVFVGGFFLIYFLVFLWNLIRAPYKQRNEARTLLLAKPKPVPLQNKTVLIRAIGKVRQKSLDLMSAQQRLDQDISPNSIDSDSRSNKDKANQEYKQAMDELEGEKLVAGDAFKDTIENLTTFLGFQVWANTTKPIQIGGDKPLVLSGFDFAARLGERVDKTIREINEISR